MTHPSNCPANGPAMSCPSSRTRTPDNGRSVSGGCVGDAVVLPGIEPRIRKRDDYRRWNSQTAIRHGSTRCRASSRECSPSEPLERHRSQFVGSDYSLCFSPRERCLAYHSDQPSAESSDDTFDLAVCTDVDCNVDLQPSLLTHRMWT